MPPKPLNASWRWRDVSREMKRRRNEVGSILNERMSTRSDLWRRIFDWVAFLPVSKEFHKLSDFLSRFVVYKKNMILWPKWLRLWDEWETSSRDFCVIPEILPCIRVIALDGWKMRTAFQHCRWHYLATLPWEMTLSDSSTLRNGFMMMTKLNSVPVTMKFACGECESWENFENLVKKNVEDQEKSSLRAKPFEIVICLKESKRDNEYLIASALSARTEPFVYIFATPTFLLRFVLVSRNSPSFVFPFRCYATCQQSRWWQTNSRITKPVLLRLLCRADQVMRPSRSSAIFLCARNWSWTKDARANCKARVLCVCSSRPETTRLERKERRENDHADLFRRRCKSRRTKTSSNFVQITTVAAVVIS